MYLKTGIAADFSINTRLWKLACFFLYIFSMKTYHDCIPCFIKQALSAARQVSDDKKIYEQVLRAALKAASELDYNDPPPIIGWRIHKKIREVTNNPDPYKEIKRSCNLLAMNLYPEMEKMVKESLNGFKTAVKLSIAGNIMDFAFLNSVDDYEIKNIINQALSQTLDPNDLHKIHEKTENAKNILYIGDNAGEIVFDKLLIEEMDSGKITYVVKGSPVINDATYEDALETGLTKLVNVIDNGTDAPGTVLGLCKNGFKDAFYKADLVISKGQANYETLNDARKNIIFLLKAKCNVVARDIGCDIGKIVAYVRE